MPDAGPPVPPDSSPERADTRYRVGCSSWLDPALIEAGTFYPALKMTAEERFRWYARFFECVEVNATYYALPSYQTEEVFKFLADQGLIYVAVDCPLQPLVPEATTD